jgi:hypothetical protein
MRAAQAGAPADARRWRRDGPAPRGRTRSCCPTAAPPSSPTGSASRRPLELGGKRRRRVELAMARHVVARRRTCGCSPRGCAPQARRTYMEAFFAQEREKTLIELIRQRRRAAAARRRPPGRHPQGRRAGGPHHPAEGPAGARAEPSSSTCRPTCASTASSATRPAVELVLSLARARAAAALARRRTTTTGGPSSSRAHDAPARRGAAARAPSCSACCGSATCSSKEERLVRATRSARPRSPASAPTSSPRPAARSCIRRRVRGCSASRSRCSTAKQGPLAR